MSVPATETVLHQSLLSITDNLASQVIRMVHCAEGPLSWPEKSADIIVLIQGSCKTAFFPSGHWPEGISHKKRGVGRCKDRQAH